MATVPSDFNAADFLFLLDPALGITTVEAARAYYISTGASAGLSYTMSSVPKTFLWQVYAAYKNTPLTVYDKRTSVIQWLISGDASNSYSVPDDFNADLYRLVYPNIAFATSIDAYIDYLYNRPHHIYNSNDLITSQSPTFYGSVHIASNASGPGSLLVDGSATVGGYIHITSNSVGPGALLTDGSATIGGTLYASNVVVYGPSMQINAYEINTSNIVIDNLGTGPALYVTQVESGIGGPQAVARFDAGSNPALFISNTGYIGVNTLTPLFPLDVSGIIHATAAVLGKNTINPGLTLDVSGASAFSSNLAIGKSYASVALDVSGASAISLGLALGMAYNGSAMLDVSGIVALVGGTAIGKWAPNVGLALDVSGTSAFSSNVAIGKSNASVALDVSGASAISLGLALGMAYNGSAMLDVSGIVALVGGTAIGKWAPNVGLALDVSGAAAISQSLAIGKSNVTSNYALDVSGTTNISSNLIVGCNIILGGNIYKTNGQLYVSSQWTTCNSSSNPSIYINSNVGIGSDYPQFTLDVSGDINFDGGLYQKGLKYIGSQWTTCNSSTNPSVYINSNVGIGSDYPQFTLDVSGDINFDGGLYQKGQKYIGSQWTTCNSSIYINSNVGYNVTSPLYTIDVCGTVNITGFLYQNGSLVDLCGNAFLTRSESVWSNYACTLTQSGTSLNVGTGGLLTCRYMKLGYFVTVEYALLFGSGATYGTNATSWVWSLPITPAATSQNRVVGSAVIASVGGTNYVGSVYSNTSNVSIILNASALGVCEDQPFVWGPGSSLTMAITYESSTASVPYTLSAAVFSQDLCGNAFLNGPSSYFSAAALKSSNLNVYGNIYSTSNIYCTGTLTQGYSDERLKTKRQPLDGAIDKLLTLSAFTYEPNDLAQCFGFAMKPCVGVSAQEVQRVVPEVVQLAPFDREMRDGQEVSISGSNYLTVQYEGLVPLIIAALKEEVFQRQALEKWVKDNACTCSRQSAHHGGYHSDGP